MKAGFLQCILECYYFKYYYYYCQVKEEGASLVAQTVKNLPGMCKT